MGRSFVVLFACLCGCATGASTQSDAPPPDTKRVDAQVDANLCTQQPCSILPQCGCVGNQACDVDTSDNNGTRCRAINMPGTETASCSSAVECDRGYVCLGGAAYSSCKKYCTNDADCGAPRGRCVYDISANGSPIAGVPPACSSNCDPVDTTAALCPSNYKCTLFTATHNSTSVKVADCSPAGTGTQGVDCTANNLPVESKCAKGYQCVKLSTETTYKCRRICDAPGTMPAGCSGNSCIGFSPAHTIGTVSYGICGP